MPHGDSGDVDFQEFFPLIGSDFRRNGEWLMTYCPVHGDGEKHKRRGSGLAGRSLGLSPRGVLKCFAGCDFKEVVDALRAGSEERRGARPQGGPARSKAAPAEAGPPVEMSMVDVYEYRDEEGVLVAVKSRWQTKDGTSKAFKWRLPESDPEKWAGLSGMPMDEMPLWGAEIVAKTAVDQWVFFVEGEKAAQACRARGLVAVTHGGGASTRKFGTALDILRDRKVALWPDNDEVGFRYMSRVSKALTGVARQVRFISVPVPEKGDAHDYFRDGGDPEKVFDSTWEQPLVEFLARDRVRVTAYPALGPVAFDFNELQFLRGEIGIGCDLTVQPSSFDEPYAQRINLGSSSAREGLERQLKKQFGDCNWTLAVSQAFARARKAFTEQEAAKPYSQCEVRVGLEYVYGPWIPRGQHSMVFGNGESGKTMLCYSLGLQIAMGVNLWGGKVCEQRNVLVLDYETGESVSAWRMQRLLAGMSADPEMLANIPIFYMWAGGIPLPEQTENIRRFAKLHDIGVLLTDSGGLATSGPPEKAESAIGYFAACAKTGIETIITISHISQLSDGSFPFGSIYWHNLARRTYHVKAKGAGTDLISTEFNPRKWNETRKEKPIGLEISFAGGDSGPISVERGYAQPQEYNPYPDEELVEATRELVMLRPGLRTWEVAKELGANQDRVKAILKSGPFEARTEQGVTGSVPRWFPRQQAI